MLNLPYLMFEINLQVSNMEGHSRRAGLRLMVRPGYRR
jgi:hypothetical protein